MKKKISIAIDGPSAAGKSTIAKMVAKKENFIYIDTGAMYRSVAFYCIKNHIDLNDEQAVEQAISNIQIRLTADNKVYLNNVDVSLQIRERGLEADLETIKKEIEQRDYQDMHRAISPLKKADDAIELDTSNMTLEEVVDQVLTLINKTREE